MFSINWYEYTVYTYTQAPKYLASKIILPITIVVGFYSVRV